MIFEVENRGDGYIVSAFHDCQWHPLRNFGERQGDARDFMLYDCRKLSDAEIKILETLYRKEVKFIRKNNKRFIKQE